ncbi:hypothetical protein [Allonocardiopsis opalescens]|uniref:Uncharacterized protein n=1 Tax=Allonocardiopsis opalescens TaxID=1144618 RepID=A0A2T0QE16_9ACTN|nr:hypothetical protein [Allonocardiopsis opalescens]PRY02184.1 hypothetical protein CLV72_101785 [Allonocardiopsis opalescens]
MTGTVRPDDIWELARSGMETPTLSYDTSSRQVLVLPNAYDENRDPLGGPLLEESPESGRYLVLLTLPELVARVAPGELDAESARRIADEINASAPWEAPPEDRWLPIASYGG